MNKDEHINRSLHNRKSYCDSRDTVTPHKEKLWRVDRVVFVLCTKKKIMFYSKQGFDRELK